ncbi:MAG: helix-turn-helix domain-containing protein [Actinomycetota bacterium]|nr:helix-turn-helix domain-containing protein [Actinomycetota bacterium]
MLAISEVARRLGVGRRTVYVLTSTGELELVHIGRGARVPVASIEHFVQRMRNHAVTKR